MSKKAIVSINGESFRLKDKRKARTARQSRQDRQALEPFASPTWWQEAVIPLRCSFEDFSQRSPRRTASLVKAVARSSFAATIPDNESNS
jgi:hypothetical protein